MSGRCAPPPPAMPSLWPSRRSSLMSAPSHARLNTVGESAAPKKQKTRMLKCACATCGYTVRTAPKWLELAGAPLCPIEDHGWMEHEPLDDEGEHGE